MNKWSVTPLTKLGNSEEEKLKCKNNKFVIRQWKCVNIQLNLSLNSVNKSN